MLKGFRESIQNTFCPTRQLAVGQTGYGVLLMNHNRHTGNFCRQAAGESNETAKTDNALDTVFLNNLLRRADGFVQRKRQHQLTLDAVAADAFNGQRFQAYAVLRHDALFHRILTTQPNHMMAALLQRLGNRQCRENMAARTAGHQHKSFTAHGFTPPNNRAFFGGFHNQCAITK